MVIWITRTERKKIQLCAKVAARAEGKGGNRTRLNFFPSFHVIHTTFYSKTTKFVI